MPSALIVALAHPARLGEGPHPANGRLLEHLALPVERVIACAFAGDDLRDLSITTVEAEPAQRSGQPLTRFLFKTRLEVAGVVKHAFAG